MITCYNVDMCSKYIKLYSIFKKYIENNFLVFKTNKIYFFTLQKRRVNTFRGEMKVE